MEIKCAHCHVYEREPGKPYCTKCLGVFPSLSGKSMLSHWRNLKEQSPQLIEDVFKVLREFRRNKIPPSPYIFKIKYKWNSIWASQVFNELVFANLISEDKHSIQWRGIDMSDSPYGFIGMAAKMNEGTLEQLLARHSGATMCIAGGHNRGRTAETETLIDLAAFEAGMSPKEYRAKHVTYCKDIPDKKLPPQGFLTNMDSMLRPLEPKPYQEIKPWKRWFKNFSHQKNNEDQ